MVKLVRWDTTGLDGINKQKKVKILYNSLDMAMICVLQTRVNLDKIGGTTDSMIGGWS